MDYKYGLSSRNKLATCHEYLQLVANRALENSPVDIIILDGYRDKYEQEQLFLQGRSKLNYPESKHNAKDSKGNPCSLALDFAPYVLGAIPWKDTHLFAVIYGRMTYAAGEVGIRLRWGGDWDMDGLTTDQTFMDWGHVEVIL